MGKLTKHLKTCSRCGKFYRTSAKFGKICPACRGKKNGNKKVGHLRLKEIVCKT